MHWRPALKIIAATWMFASLPTHAAERTGACLAYEQAAVALTGRIKIAKAFGPPGYGEDPKHDSKEDYPELLLTKPICVAGDAADPVLVSEENIRKIQLVFPAGRFDHALLGKPVTASGKLFHQISGHHHTRVLMTVDAIWEN